MSLSQQLAGELKQLAGYAGPSIRTATISDPSGNADIALDFTAVDSLSCSLHEFRIQVPALTGAGVDVLQQWAADLCRRVTYLLENIGPLEIDADASEVLIRSTPPDRQSGATSFYEILLQSQGNGSFSLRRYRTEKQPPARHQVEMNFTHEVLTKLVNDLVDTIP